ncbi:AAEL009969-PA [Aedes aegypti]|uniref:Dynein light chain n=4 Tax=Stegomyia TaxID=53541 RepID=Q16UB1_AEDAE|nr:dynein light chain 4, axonemal [Aedes aegypti]XP_019547208.1 dynein light chain 4, axonemal [Aedes albopictus]XP_029727507.1 dynein light chain 4, axonemal [Aedes albopictus]EAT38105.1 AAEL009969-PA [Aedes aegypti]
MDDQPKAEGEADKKIVHIYPLVKFSDMNDDVRAEAIELSITACEKYAQNYEHAAKAIKELMDKKFGTFWHVVVGEGFGYEVSYETKNILYLFFGGNLAIVLWKCS